MTNPPQLRHCPSKWIVGLDLRLTSKGAVDFARWLHEATVTEPPELAGLHVLEEAHMQAALRYHHLAELEQAAREAVDMAVRGAGADACLTERFIVQAVKASDALTAAQSQHQAGGIIIGRLAPRQGGRIFRLGRTARRLLRQLPGPVVVVPPDFVTPADDGPVIVTTNLRQDASTAMHFGVEFARQTGRPVIALYIVPEPDYSAARYIPAQSREKIAAQEEQDGKLGIKKWLTGLGLHVDHEVVISGHVTESAVDYAREKGAALLVCGSRRLSTVERVLLTSIGSELAANASCPVAVVPPLEADMLQ